MKILTITFNASIDKTYVIPDFKSGIIQKPDKIISWAGGKGINVSRVLKSFEINSHIFCALGGNNGEFIKEYLKKEKLEFTSFDTKKESRLCITIVNPDKNEETIINEYGKEIDISLVGSFLLQFAQMVKKYDLIVISGSVHKNVDGNFYRELIKISNRNNVKVFLDASKEQLKNGIEATPFLICPNRQELMEYLGLKKIDVETIKDALINFNKSGIEIPIVTMGKEGSLTYYNGNFYRGIPPEVESLSPIGCGDSFLAGFIFGYINKLDIIDCLRYATSASSANVTKFGAGLITIADINKFYKKSRVIEERGQS